jgi:S-adenosylhomocysteine hydrolase
MLPKHLDEKVARLHLQRIGAKLDAVHGGVKTANIINNRMGHAVLLNCSPTRTARY